jgi:hypothetical protein
LTSISAAVKETEERIQKIKEERSKRAEIMKGIDSVIGRKVETASVRAGTDEESTIVKQM